MPKPKKAKKKGSQKTKGQIGIYINAGPALRQKWRKWAYDEILSGRAKNLIGAFENLLKSVTKRKSQRRKKVKTHATKEELPPA
jgi:chemotaxis regulatin CheY-phosphate phosphatase CheZ